jgi:hypothetical protein
MMSLPAAREEAWISRTLCGRTRHNGDDFEVRLLAFTAADPALALAAVEADAAARVRNHQLGVHAVAGAQSTSPNWEKQVMKWTAEK